MVNAKAYKTEKIYLSAKEDSMLDGKVLVIDSVFEQEIQDNQGNVKESLCVRFKDVKKILSLNQTNLTLCMTAFGDNTDNWVNEKVKFSIVNTSFKGDITKGIQITPQ